MHIIFYGLILGPAIAGTALIFQQFARHHLDVDSNGGHFLLQIALDNNSFGFAEGYLWFVSQQQIEWLFVREIGASKG
jgi:hypothetical protein